MSLNYDFMKCEGPKDDNERVALDCLIWATMTVGLGEITEKNAHEFFSRIALYEKAQGPFRTSGKGGVYFTPQEIKRWIGLKTNVSPMTKNQFLKRFEFELNQLEKRYFRECDEAAS